MKNKKREPKTPDHYFRAAMCRRHQSSYGMCLFASGFNGFNGSHGRTTKAFPPSTYMWLDWNSSHLLQTIVVSHWLMISHLFVYGVFFSPPQQPSHILLHWSTALSQWMPFVKWTAATASSKYIVTWYSYRNVYQLNNGGPNYHFITSGYYCSGLIKKTSHDIENFDSVGWAKFTAEQRLSILSIEVQSMDFSNFSVSQKRSNKIKSITITFLEINL